MLTLAASAPTHTLHKTDPSQSPTEAFAVALNDLSSVYASQSPEVTLAQ
jgi:hypothetical protein